MCAYVPLELYNCWLLMYTSTLEKIECKMLFTWVTRGIWACFAVSSSSAFASSLCFFFYFFRIVSFVTTTPDKFQCQSQVPLSQINVVVSIRLKFTLYAVFFKWGSRTDFLFMGRQNTVNYWDFPSRFPETATKVWYRKLLINEKCF